jgi:UDP-N-acetylglucosamine/UDP-N-acetylgalactosamine diphosphorylase
LREEEFAPLKNATGEDSPTTAKEYLEKLHRKWLKDAGVKL